MDRNTEINLLSAELLLVYRHIALLLTQNFTISGSLVVCYFLFSVLFVVILQYLHKTVRNG